MRLCRLTSSSIILTFEDQQPIWVGSEKLVLHLHKLTGPEPATANNCSNPLPVSQMLLHGQCPLDLRRKLCTLMCWGSFGAQPGPECCQPFRHQLEQVCHRLCGSAFWQLRELLGGWQWHHTEGCSRPSFHTLQRLPSTVRLSGKDHASCCHYRPVGFPG